MGDLPVGGVAAEVKPISSHSTSFAEPNRLEIGAENWAAAEKAAAEIIRKVQPTSVSEERRKEVVDYIQRLIRDFLGAENSDYILPFVKIPLRVGVCVHDEFNCGDVFPYGSVPLKTYLPDGDIDLTAFGVPNVEDTLADKMISVLEDEERNTAADFTVKDVQLIRAEVKLVKCIVQDIVVDISFNQIGGLCTLCFLEQVDRLIGRDHLFKRSIILIKAWCYYESRILGAHHGLISTYALETLVLYIFHLYHSELDGPLAVLYKFLDYFSKFDWYTYCVSLNGQVRLSSLPAFVAEIPEDSDKDLLLTNDFLTSCLSMFSVLPDKNSRGFISKNLNILDPLKVDNNLGRSVSKGNFYRIRSAFSFGSRTLAHILRQPQDSIANELQKFFGNAMARHGGGQRPDVQDFDKLLISNRPVSPVSFSDSGFCRTGNFYESVDEYEASSGKLSKYLPQVGTEKRDSVEGKHDCISRNGSDDSNRLDKYEKYASLSDTGTDKLDLNHVDTDRTGVRSELAESLKSMDLSGDYDSYIQHLYYGRWCCEYGLSMHSMPLSPLPSAAPYPWESLHPLLHYNHNGFSLHHNGFHPSPPIYGMQPVLLPHVPFTWDDVPKHRGTGTYLPNTNLHLHGNRPSSVKGRNQAPSKSTRQNGKNTTRRDPYLLDKSSQELLHPVVNTVSAASATATESYIVFPPHQNGLHIPNDSIIQKEGIEVESALDNSRAPRTVSSSPRTPSGVPKQQAALSRDQDRVSMRSSYRLKDEEDFPPLST